MTCKPSDQGAGADTADVRRIARAADMVRSRQNRRSVAINALANVSPESPAYDEAAAAARLLTKVEELEGDAIKHLDEALRCALRCSGCERTKSTVQAGGHAQPSDMEERLVIVIGRLGRARAALSPGPDDAHSAEVAPLLRALELAERDANERLRRLLEGGAS